MSFEANSRGDLLYYTSTMLAPRHGFSTRLGGVSTGHLASMNLGIHRGDDPANVLENYRIMAEAVGFDPHKAVLSAQVHEDTVRHVTPDDWGKGLYAPIDYSADALMTDVPGTTLFVFSADCGTIVLHDPKTGAVGVAHAGWRGTALGIAGKTALAMQETFGCDPADLRAALGPCISRCCFETDADVPNAMCKALGEEAEAYIDVSGSKFHVDLKGINRAFLLRAGLLPEHIDVTDLCTACDPDTFWSYRRHGDRRGSLSAFITCGDAL